MVLTLKVGKQDANVQADESLAGDVGEIIKFLDMQKESLCVWFLFLYFFAHSYGIIFFATISIIIIFSKAPAIVEELMY